MGKSVLGTAAGPAQKKLPSIDDAATDDRKAVPEGDLFCRLLHFRRRGRLPIANPDDNDSGVEARQRSSESPAKNENAFRVAPRRAQVPGSETC